MKADEKYVATLKGLLTNVLGEEDGIRAYDAVELYARRAFPRAPALGIVLSEPGGLFAALERRPDGDH